MREYRVYERVYRDNTTQERDYIEIILPRREII
jgi:hypothetical protein